MPLTGNVGHDIKAELAAGKPLKQAEAIALSEHRKDASPKFKVGDKVAITTSGNVGVVSRVDRGGVMVRHASGFQAFYTNDRVVKTDDDGRKDALSPWVSRWSDRELKEQYDKYKNSSNKPKNWTDIKNEYEIVRAREMGRMDAVKQNLPEITPSMSLSSARAAKALAQKLLNEEKDPRVQEYYRDAIDAYSDVEKLWLDAGRKDAEDRPLQERLDSMQAQANSLGKGAARMDAAPPSGTVVQEVGRDWKIYRTKEGPTEVYVAYNVRTKSRSGMFFHHVSDAETWVRLTAVGQTS